MASIHDFTDFPEALRRHAIRLMEKYGLLRYDDATNSINETERAQERRREIVENDPLDGYLAWVAFSVGVECLAKAVLLQHDEPILRQRRHVRRIAEAARARLRPSRLAPAVLAQGICGRAQGVPEDEDALQVYLWVTSDTAQGLRPSWMDPAQDQRLGSGADIRHPLEIHTGDLGAIYSGRLQGLVRKGKLTGDDRLFLEDALRTLADIRRNVDLHVFLKCVVVGSINGDLTLHLKAVNLLLDVFDR